MPDIPTGRDSLDSIIAQCARIRKVAEQHGDGVLDIEGSELAALDERMGELADELEQ